MRNIVILLALSLIACGCGKNSPDTLTGVDPSAAVYDNGAVGSTGLRAGTSFITGTDYLPLNPGRRWTLYNEQYPDRITTITITSDGHMYFEKNHPDTYHGFRNTNLLWSVTDNGRYIFGADENDTSTGTPDDIRYDRATGNPSIFVWMHTLTLGIPPNVLIPSGSFKVPSDFHSNSSYHIKFLDGSFEGDSPVCDWYVRWSLKSNNDLLVQFNETYVSSPAFVYEDWTLRKNIGIVEISQWNDPGRMSLIRRVKAGR